MIDLLWPAGYKPRADGSEHALCKLKQFVATMVALLQLHGDCPHRYMRPIASTNYRSRWGTVIVERR